MYARITQFEIDAVQISVPAALERFRSAVLPELRTQQGYRGLYVLTTPEGRGMLISFWDTAEAEEAGRASGYYSEQIGKFTTFYRQPPGRDLFEVTYMDAPAATGAGGPS